MYKSNRTQRTETSILVFLVMIVGAEEAHEVIHAELSRRFDLITAQRSRRELSLGILKIEDTLLYCLLDGQLIDIDGAFLPVTIRAIKGLVLNKRVCENSKRYGRSLDTYLESGIPPQICQDDIIA